jgi:hypothetical protein
VASFWLEGQALLLQLSSYTRHEGSQEAAAQRLNERITRQPQAWRVWTKRIHPNCDIDQASAEFTDKDGVMWVHSYLVWPHLTVYATVSGPPHLVIQESNWAVQSLASTELIVH